ncbi:hypothetical protein Tco_0746385, partial [Tanacetum coccineum]
QSGGSPKKVGDEAINEEMLDSVERAITIDASLDAAQDSDNITKTQSTTTLNEFERVLEQPIEPPLSKDHTSGSGEGGCSSCEDPQTKEKSQEIRKTKEVKHLTTKKEKIRTCDFDGFDDETVDAAITGVSTASAPVTTTGVAISTTEPKTPPTTTTVFDDKDVTMAMAQTLIKMKEEKAKEKGVAFKDVEDSSRPVRSITTLQPLPSIDPKDKGKGILVEGEPVKVKRKDQGLAQIESDAELAHRLNEEELAKIERIQKEKAAQEEVLMVAIYEEYDTIQSSIDADALFVAKLQQEDREQFTIKESWQKQ